MDANWGGGCGYLPEKSSMMQREMKKKNTRSDCGFDDGCLVSPAFSIRVSCISHSRPFASIRVHWRMNVVIEQKIPTFFRAFLPPFLPQFHTALAIIVVLGNEPAFHLL